MADSPVLPGERLKEERNRQKLEEREVADKLNLTVNYLRALEADDYEHLPGATFIKGYIRNYARLLDMPASELTDAFDALSHPFNFSGQAVPEPVESLPEAQGRKQKIGIAVIIILVIIVLVIWWAMAGDANNKPAATPSDAPAQATAKTQTPTTTTSTSDDTHENANIANKVAGADESQTDEADANGSVGDIAGKAGDSTAVMTAELNIAFTGDCWVEVADASGKLLFKGAKHAGASLSVSGQSPLSVMLGNTAAVSTLSVNGSAVDLPHKSAGKVIHLQLP